MFLTNISLFGEWFKFTELQLNTLLILAIICAASILFCFVVGQITGNNSQMDKLWSILPIVYTWVVVFKSNFNFRCIIIAILVTYWGVRLTINFGRKGAYKLKFWEGEEDYRWKWLRARKPFSNKVVWFIFNLLFISFYQNFLVLLISLPSVALMESAQSFNFLDGLALAITFGSITLELIADEQQWKFHKEKKKLAETGTKLENMPSPYNLGFNTTGLWNKARHPNYLGEQFTWIGVYIFSIAASCGLLNWSIVGCILLILLFLGSSTLGESISCSKYPLYKDYKKKVLRYIPLSKKYRK